MKTAVKNMKRTYSFEQASQKSYVDNKERSVTVEDTYDDGSKKKYDL